MRIRRRKDRDRKDEKGAILVELAFVVPVLVLIVVGMFEMGIAWRHKVSTSQAVRQSVRVASHLGNGTSDADYEAILTLRSSMFQEWDEVEYVVIYKADVNGEMTTTNCHTQSVANVCNFYSIADINSSLGDSTLSYWQSVEWAPSSRSSSVLSPDHIGVFVQMNNDWQTNMFPGDGIKISGQAVMRVEPDVG